MPAPEPFAVAHSRGFILDCDRKAALRGVRPGMAVPTALALAARLVLRPRDPAAETEAVLGLAAWAVQFTPTVAIELPDAVLLEVSGSLQLFGGVKPITTRLRAGLTDMGYDAMLASAPTPLAAYWMARTGDGHCITDAGLLHAALSALPLSAMDRDADRLEALQGIGAATLGDLLALPRDGMARRFGQPLLDQIDRALGRLPDPRTPFQPPASFHASIELPAEVTQAEALLFAARRLLVQLAGFLAARAGGVQRITMRLVHRDAVTEVPIGLVVPSRDSAHFTLLLRERLASLALREPVRSITVAASDILPLAGENLGLFVSDAIAPGSWEKLIERLRARLGTQAVHGIASADEHRPERASAIREPRTKSTTGSAAGSATEPKAGLKTAPRTGPRNEPRPEPQQSLLRLEEPSPGERPFWLLKEPRLIREIGSVPHHDGPLELLAGPERIETGWWDAGEIARDYFVARSPERSLLWIYRERKALDVDTGWYLHGIFA